MGRCHPSCVDNLGCRRWRRKWDHLVVSLHVQLELLQTCRQACHCTRVGQPGGNGWGGWCQHTRRAWRMGGHGLRGTCMPLPAARHYNPSSTCAGSPSRKVVWPYNKTTAGLAAACAAASLLLGLSVQQQAPICCILGQRDLHALPRLSQCSMSQEGHTLYSYGTCSNSTGVDRHAWLVGHRLYAPHSRWPAAVSQTFGQNRCRGRAPAAPCLGAPAPAAAGSRLQHMGKQ